MASERSPDRPSIREFLVDLLGGLVPGALFTSAALLSLMWPLWVLFRQLQKAAPISKESVTQITNFASAFRLELVIFFIVGSYVIGHIFFRLDPKVPDQRSYARVSAKFSEKDRKTWVVRKIKDKDKEEEDCQFPYLFLHEYLDDRGLTHLAGLVPWEGSDPATHKNRTKGFINILKVRLFFFFPERCGHITRNEAHVRLMASIWYASNILILVAALGLGICGAAAVVDLLGRRDFLPPLIPAVFVGMVLSVARLMEVTIERFLHYQRVREVIYVLETAYVAAKEKKEILEELL